MSHKIDFILCFVIHLGNVLFEGKLFSVYIKKDFSYNFIPQFSSRDKSYQSEDEALRPFYDVRPTIDSFDKLIKERKGIRKERALLVDILNDQYSNVANCDITKENIKKLGYPNSFTVVTAHQPSLLTGPLYYIYKICSAISLANRLNELHPTYNIIPTFVLGAEDHDFEEIASVHLFNKTFTWETDQKGAVGRMHLDGLTEVLNEIKGTFGQMPHAEALSEIIDQSYEKSKTYGQFAFHLTHQLFVHHGLVIINMDSAELKRIFLPIALQELKENFAHKLVEEDQLKLEKAGFKSQAHAREINLFLHESDRERIIENEDATYSVGDKVYTLQELTSYITQHPDKLSPNVVLRPVMQELILPNLAYIGGGGEIAYWMERISLFKYLNIPFPMLIRRDSVLIVDKRSADTLEKANITIKSMFDREEQIVNQYALDNASIDINLDHVKNSISAAYADIVNLSDQVDPTLSKSVMAEEAKAIKSIEYIETKLLKAEKKKKENEINKIIRVKQKLFPNNDSLQERYDNFIPYYLRYGKEWIDALVDQLDPMDKSFKILIEES